MFVSPQNSYVEIFTPKCDPRLGPGPRKEKKKKDIIGIVEINGGTWIWTGELDNSPCINVELPDFVNCAVIMKEIDLDFEIHTQEVFRDKGACCLQLTFK